MILGLSLVSVHSSCGVFMQILTGSFRCVYSTSWFKIKLFELGWILIRDWKTRAAQYPSAFAL